MKSTHQTLLAILLIIVGIATRFFPHPANFTAIGSLALFAGLYLPKKWALAVPLGAMLLSDLFIGFYNWKIMTLVYLSFAVVVALGLLVRKHKRFSTIVAGTLAGSLLFFAITNAAVWAFGTMYPKTITGLAQSYIMAIPFFKHSLLGDVFYTTLLV